ncbi:MAG TPA: MazG nucleotide pyrophosphohydrolase domain-containing protein, partial [Gemmatimonadales bacterium]|nr:MazG nucleotide pyrophosphohydrolase domain-containing protein [Gemmatimonadales bacterium]
MQEESALGRAMAMVRELRIRCPWDRIQTRETLRPYLVEEVHELDQALGSGDPAAIRDEVADLLLHVAWQLVLAEECGEFTPDDAAGDVELKMKRRHPHLFELGRQESWEKLKQSEERI